MEVMISWLAENGIGGHTFWVGAADRDGVDEVLWVENGWVVLTSFWSTDEPVHNNGDCVFLNIISMGLFMGDCEASRPSMCQYRL